MSIVERALKKLQETKPPRAETALDREEAVTRPVVGLGTEASPVSAGVPPPSPAGQTISIDLSILRRDGRVSPLQFAEQTEDEFRRIKWPLLKRISGGSQEPAENNVVLVTSAVPGEGKTFCSLGLALSIARDRDLKVVLADADVVSPALTTALGLEGKKGMTDLLADPDLELASVLHGTDVPGLWFLPAGSWHDESPEFFSGRRMEFLIESLSRQASPGVVILDSPPVLATNEAQVASRYVGQVLLVVEADNTEQKAVSDALALLAPDKPVSAVLNKVKKSALSHYYGHYYYGSHYGSAYSSRRRSVSEGT
jgi:receptor protein-tyrosine kinase